MSRMKMSAAFAAMAIAAVGTWEGFRQSAYWDPYGRVWTVCYGETRGVKKGDWHTKEQCDEMLANGLVEFETAMQRCLVEDGRRIPDKSYLAFLDLSYNIGSAGFCRSSVRTWANRYMHSGRMSDLTTACARIKLYVKSGGRTLRGLVNRRTDFYGRCIEGVREKVVTGVEAG